MPTPYHYALDLFRADDTLLLTIPLTAEQADVLKAVHACEDDPECVCGGYEIRDVYFGAVEDLDDTSSEGTESRDR